MGCLVTLHWVRGWVAGLLPTGGEGGLHGYSPLGKLVLWLLPAWEVGFRVTPHWGRGCVTCVLPAGEEGGLHDYSLLGERVGCMVTSRWGSWFYGCFPLGKLVSGLLPAG